MNWTISLRASFDKLNEYRRDDWQIVLPFEKNFVSLRTPGDYVIFGDSFSLLSRRGWVEVAGSSAREILFSGPNITKLCTKFARIAYWCRSTVWNTTVDMFFWRKTFDYVSLKSLVDDAFTGTFHMPPTKTMGAHHQFGYAIIEENILPWYVFHTRLGHVTPDFLMSQQYFGTISGWDRIFPGLVISDTIPFEFAGNSYSFIWWTLMICAFIFITLFFATALNHPIYAVLQLVASFLGVFLLFLFLGLEYVGLLILLVYVGAIAVLMLFVIMLLDLKEIVLIKKVDRKTFRLLFFGFFILFLMAFSLVCADSGFIVPVSYNCSNDFLNTAPMNWIRPREFNLDIVSIGSALFTFFPVEFLLCAFILYIPMVGVISLLQNLSPITKRQALFAQVGRNNQLRLIR